MEFTFEDLAREKGYTSFTPLQQQAFSEKNKDYILSETQNIFVIGETSSGKTLIPVLMYLYLLRKSPWKSPKMLFIVPYRALAAQKLREFRTLFEGDNLSIEQSTGEYRDHDEDIIKGHVNIALIIAEKAFIFAANDPDFLSKYELIVIDEFALITSEERGSKLDFLLSMIQDTQVTQHLKHSRDRKDQRVIALGTPFLNWSAYIKHYNFHTVVEKTRPVEVREIPIFHEYIYDEGIRRLAVHTDSDNIHDTDNYPFPKSYSVYRLKTSGNLEIASDVFMCNLVGAICKRTKPYKLSSGSICSHAGMSVKCRTDFAPTGVPFDIIPVVQLCRHHLQKGHQILIFRNDREWVRNAAVYLYTFLKDLIGIFLPQPQDTETNKNTILKECGLFEEDLYGILGEEHYLALAAGIGFHSSAIPNQLRSYVENNFLEHKNLKIVCSTETLAYGVNSSVDVVIIADMTKSVVGKQSFLTLNEYFNYKGRAGRGISAEKIGYVYPFIRLSGPMGAECQSEWNRIKRIEKELPVCYSHILEGGGTYLPFFLLTIIPTSGEHKKPRTFEELLETIQRFPLEKNLAIQNLRDLVYETLKYLVDNGLIEKKKIKDDSDNIGKRKKGKHRNQPDYGYTLRELGKTMRGYVISRNDYSLLVASLRENTSDDGILSLSNFLKDLMDSDLLQDRISDISAGKDIDCSDALLAWCTMCSPRHLQKHFGIPYPLLERLASSVTYLLDVAQHITPVIPLSSYSLDEKKIIRQGIASQLKEFAFSIQFGIEVPIYKEFYEYLTSVSVAESEDIASKMMRRYSMDSLDPVKASYVRRYLMVLKTNDTMDKIEKYFNSFRDDEKEILKTFYLQRSEKNQMT